jgi:hypothetical protein
MPVFKRQFHNPNATISNFLYISDMYKYAQYSAKVIFKKSDMQLHEENAWKWLGA